MQRTGTSNNTLKDTSHSLVLTSQPHSVYPLLANLVEAFLSTADSFGKAGEVPHVAYGGGIGVTLHPLQHLRQALQSVHFGLQGGNLPLQCTDIIGCGDNTGVAASPTTLRKEIQIVKPAYLEISLTQPLHVLKVCMRKERTVCRLRVGRRRNPRWHEKVTVAPWLH